MPKYILVAVDGTGSHEWFNGGNSYTRKFFEQFNTHGGFKMYMHGPDWQMTGYDAKQRIKDAKLFVDESIRAINLERDNFENAPTLLAGSVAELGVKLIGRYDTSDIEFILIGHSRGGAIVIELAKQLPQKALFMGLYDAVDMSFFIEASEISNVKTVFHATRKSNSRSSWGNAGTVRSRSVGEYVEMRFHTSHGGINGGYELNPTGFTADTSCAIYQPLDERKMVVYGQGAVIYYKTEAQKELERKIIEKNKKEVESCIQDSMKADSFIRSGAMWSGLTFDGTEMQSIFYDKSDGHIRKR